jgi:exoribonuclease-2
MDRDQADHRNSQLRRIAKQVMLEAGFEPGFSPEAQAEADALQRPASESGGAIRDLRELLWCSIDNDDSRDLDQLSVAAALPDGAVTLYVAIADVDSLVHKGSALDAHARANTTSIYTPIEVFPMLPEHLSTDLTSLNQDQDRLAIVVEYVVDQSGVPGASQLYRARVRNRAKLAYNAVAAWLDGTAPAPAALAAVAGLEDLVRLQDRAAQSMKENRHHHGALSLETLEARAVFDTGVLTDLAADEKNRAKELIEELMVAANGCAARFLESKRSPSLRRVLRSPERWGRIVGLAADLGETLPPEPDVAALQGFLVRRRQADPTRFPDLSLSVIKLLGSGEYVMELPGQPVEGHFGLALKDYAHSTAPNRRFPDLITQRLLKAALAGQAPPYANDELGTLATRCTEREDEAAKVERRVRKSVAASLLEHRIGEGFDSIVTGASDKGTWVRISHPVVEGKLVHDVEGLDVGDRVRVKLVRTDVERGFIDFERSR